MTLKYKRILVAIDGSQEAEWAFKKSIEIAKRNEAALNLIYVVDTRSYSAMTKSVPDPEDRIFDHGKELLNNYKKDALAAGIASIHVYVVPGSPDKVISRDYAKRLDIDLIVCGAQGLNAIEQYILGSVSQHIVSSSPCDVLVVRREQKTEE
ncbi:universal stress protein [Planococcus halocryophilus]|uniref:universal stress protein n=1 Tax=Planococcus halocryophilus TaxID=1215089 RepID=UPI001F0E603E|nr:universal stress protein [Planococcus halocryophilus]MCH4826333.1 universal stress protein [Planococcus halocryophilus]